MYDFEEIDFWAETQTQDGKEVSGSTIIESKAQKRIVKNNEVHFIKARALSDLCGRPKKNEQFRIITEKQFNAYAVILNLIEQNEIDEIHLAIYRINQPTVESLISFIDCGKIKKASFIISNFFNQTKKPEIWAKRLKSYCNNNPNCRHAYTHNHAKVLCVKMEEEYFVFEGSGNMSDNARVEQYLYENNKQAFDFHKEWINKIIDNGN